MTESGLVISATYIDASENNYYVLVREMNSCPGRTILTS